jgi:hypothetical protein
MYITVCPQMGQEHYKFRDNISRIRWIAHTRWIVFWIIHFFTSKQNIMNTSLSKENLYWGIIKYIIFGFEYLAVKTCRQIAYTSGNFSYLCFYFLKKPLNFYDNVIKGKLNKWWSIISPWQIMDYYFTNCIRGVMVSVFPSSLVDRGFEPRSGQNL